MVNLNSFFISPTNFSNNKGFGGVLAEVKSGCDKGSGYQSCWIWAAFFCVFLFLPYLSSSWVGFCLTFWESILIHACFLYLFSYDVVQAEVCLGVKC